MKKFLNTQEAALRLEEDGYLTTSKTLGKLACVGGGPRFYKFGNRRLYTEADLLAWAESKLTGPVSSTSEAA